MSPVRWLVCTALALAGGPVLAKALTLPVVRLRASMRVDDSLQKGASYFHAELAKLRSVVAGAESWDYSTAWRASAAVRLPSGECGLSMPAANCSAKTRRSGYAARRRNSTLTAS